MIKGNLRIGFVFLFALLLTVSAVYAEINLSTSGGKLGIKAAGKTTNLDSNTTETTVSDSSGAKVDINYNAAEGTASLASSTGTATLTYNIAKIFLDNGESADVGPTGPYGSFYITNTSGEGKIVVIFPDNSKITMPPSAKVSLTFLADDNFNLKVLEGTVEYVDAKGNAQMLTPNSPAIFVKGFGQVPGWRSIEPDRLHPATP
ncbi:MAG: hypothetical protein WCI77_02525 [Candidatus Omnitrophota bacterium]